MAQQTKLVKHPDDAFSTMARMQTTSDIVAAEQRVADMMDGLLIQPGRFTTKRSRVPIVRALRDLPDESSTGLIVSYIEWVESERRDDNSRRDYQIEHLLRLLVECAP